MKHQYMTDEEIQAAEQRCQQATPGEWKFDSGLVPPDGPQTYCEVYTEDETIIAEVNDKITEGKSNGEFMSHARTDLPKALSDLRELRRLVRELAGALTDAKGHLEYCGYGDAWERDAAYHEKLPEALDAALALARQVEGGK